MAKFSKAALKKRQEDRAKNGAENYEPKEYKTPRKHCPECESSDFQNEDGADDDFRLYMSCNDCGLQWYEPADLENLRLSNEGYNPEDLEVTDPAQITVSKNGQNLSILSQDKEVYNYRLTECKNEEEYIRQYSGTYGVIYSKKFWKQL